MRLFSRIVTSAFALGLGAICLAGDDLDYARALARDGHEELARDWCERVRRDPRAAEDDRAGVRLVEAELLARAAWSQESGEEARKRLDEAVAALEGFLKERPGHRLAAEARLQAGVLRRQTGELLGRLAEAEADAPAKSKLREAAREAYAKAEAALGELAAERRAAHDAWVRRTDGRTPSAAERAEEEAILEVHLEADLIRARALAGRARLTDPGAERDRALAAALDAFVNFEFDWGQSPALHEASLTWAEVLEDLGRPRDAISRLDHAVSLRDAGRTAGGRFQLGAWERTVVLRAYGAKAALLNAQRDPAAALAATDEMLLTDPTAAKDRHGFLALLQKVDALAALGRAGEAGALARRLAQEAPSPALAALAARRFLQAAAPDAAAPEILALLADQQIGQGQWEAGIVTLRRALARVDREAPAADLWWKLARAYDVHAGKLYEAAAVYEKVATDFPEHERAPEAAFHAARAWNRLAAQAGLDRGWEKDQVERLLKMLARGWPQNAFARDAQFLVAEAMYERGQVLEAAREWARVAPEATLYEQAQVAAGQAFSRAAAERWAKADRGAETRALFRQAEEAFRRYLALAERGAAAEARVLERRPAVTAVCRQALAAVLVHEADPRPGEALEALADVDTTAADPKLRRQAASLRLRALLNLNRLEDATAVAEAILQRFPGAPAALDAAQQVAAALDARGEERAGVAPVPGRVSAEAVRAWREAARFYEVWGKGTLDAGRVAERRGVLEVADRLWGLARLVAGVEEGLPAEGVAVGEPALFRSAAALYVPLCEAAPVAGDAAGKVNVRAALALAHAGDLEGARDALERLVQAERVAEAGGRGFNAGALRGRGWLFAAYADLGQIYLRLASAGTERDRSFDAAWAIFAAVIANAARESAGWWQAKAGVLRVLLERGRQGDFEQARLGLRDLRANYPELDGGAHGVREVIERLERKVAEREPR